LRRSFPDVAITIEDLIVEDATIVMRYIERARQRDPFLGIGPRVSATQSRARPSTASRTRASRDRGESEDTLGWFASSESTSEQRPTRFETRSPGCAPDLVQRAWAATVRYGAIGRTIARRALPRVRCGSMIGFPPSVIFGEGRISIGAGTSVGPLRH